MICLKLHLELVQFCLQTSQVLVHKIVAVFSCGDLLAGLVNYFGVLISDFSEFLLSLCWFQLLALAKEVLLPLRETVHTIWNNNSGINPLKVTMSTTNLPF